MRRFGSRCGAICKVVPLIKQNGTLFAPHFVAVSAAAAAVVAAAAVIVATATAAVASAISGIVVAEAAAAAHKDEDQHDPQAGVTVSVVQAHVAHLALRHSMRQSAKGSLATA